MLSVVRNVDDALLGGHLGAQRPKLSFVLSGRLAHNDRCTPVVHRDRLDLRHGCELFSGRRPDVLRLRDRLQELTPE